MTGEKDSIFGYRTVERGKARSWGTIRAHKLWNPGIMRTRMPCYGYLNPVESFRFDIRAS